MRQIHISKAKFCLAVNKIIHKSVPIHEKIEVLEKASFLTGEAKSTLSIWGVH